MPGCACAYTEGEAGVVKFDEDITLDLLDPMTAVSRMMFELTGALGWPGAPPRVPALEGRALVSYLVARDNLLSLEAELVMPDDPRPSLNALETVKLGTAEREVRDVALEIWSRQASAQGANGVTASVADSVGQACCVVNSSWASARCGSRVSDAGCRRPRDVW